MQKALIGILAVTTVALGVWCAVLSKQLRASREQARAVAASAHAEAEAREAQSTRITELQHARDRLDQQVQQFTTVTTKLRASEAQQASNLTALAERAGAAQATGGAGQTPAAGEGGLFGKEMGSMLEKMMKDPAMREMVKGQQKAAINMMYAGLFKELNLTPEEKDKLQNLLTDAQMKQIEKAQTLFGGEETTESAASEQSLADEKKQTDAEIKALLGEEKFAQYEDYQKNINERMQLDQLGNHLETQNLPLDAGQMKQLLQVMKDEKASVPPVIPTDPNPSPKQMKNLFTAENLDKQMQWMDDYNRRVLDRASQFLSPDQAKQYREFQEQQTSMQKLGLKMAREMFGGGKGAAPPAPRPVK